jgi:hypothetical protein
MILKLLCIWLVFYSILSLLMHGTMNLKDYHAFCLYVPLFEQLSQLTDFNEKLYGWSSFNVGFTFPEILA